MSSSKVREASKNEQEGIEAPKTTETKNTTHEETKRERLLEEGTCVFSFVGTLLVFCVCVCVCVPGATL